MFAIQRKVLATRFEGTILIAQLIVSASLLVSIAVVFYLYALVLFG